MSKQGSANTSLRGIAMSVEAFAMAGADYMECAINIYALEQRFKQPPPPLAKPEAEKSLSSQVDKSHATSLRLDIVNIGMECVKLKMREGARAVASHNEMKANLKSCRDSSYNGTEMACD